MDLVEVAVVGAIGIATSFTGSMGAFLIWVHYDLDGHWQERRLRHGQTLEEKARHRAEKIRQDHADAVRELVG